jgi:hypothetical protein
MFFFKSPRFQAFFAARAVHIHFRYAGSAGDSLTAFSGDLARLAKNTKLKLRCPYADPQCQPA